jgi:phosphatidylglycerophosphatase A
MRALCAHIATLGPLGYVPAAGTMASLLTALILYILQPSLLSFSLSLPVLLIMAYYCIAYALPFFKVPDPSCIVLDEVIGCGVTYLGLTFLGLSEPLFLVAGLILFRVLDITKPFPISWAETLPGAYGVLADDIVAGIAAGILSIVGILLVIAARSAWILFYGL